MHFYPALTLESIKALSPEVRWSLLYHMDRIKARESLSFMNNVAACFVKDSKFKQALVAQAFKDDPVTHAIVLEALTRED